MKYKTKYGLTVYILSETKSHLCQVITETGNVFSIQRNLLIKE